MNEDAMIDTAFNFVKCINRRDAGGLGRLMTEDRVFIDPAGEAHRGRENMVEGWRRYFSAFPDYMLHIRLYTIRGRDVIFTGRTTGSHLQISRE